MFSHQSVYLRPWYPNKTVFSVKVIVLYSKGSARIKSIFPYKPCVPHTGKACRLTSVYSCNGCAVAHAVYAQQNIHVCTTMFVRERGSLHGNVSIRCVAVWIVDYNRARYPCVSGCEVRSEMGFTPYFIRLKRDAKCILTKSISTLLQLS